MTLKELRKSKGLSQLEAAQIVNVGLRSYKRYELDANQSSPKHQYIFKCLSEIKDKIIPNIEQFDIVIVGIGYVGFSIGVLLSEKHNITMVDLEQNKVDLVNKNECPFKDDKINEWLNSKKLNIKATSDGNSVYENADYIIIATPTNFDINSNSFDTSSVVSVYKNARKVNKKAVIVVKSTVPIGFVESFMDSRLIFVPEFLREGHALEDNLYPSRIIVGGNPKDSRVSKFGKIMKDASLINCPLLFMTSTEAEAVKLFSNSYLAMRVAYFNELDTYAETNNLRTSEIIKGISLDSRIGDYYNNPSFGYGGYCLPKDSAQLKSSFLDIPNNNLISAIVESNQTRKQYIANQIIKKAMEISKKDIKDITIGVYRLIMKSGSDNYRSSAIIDVIKNIEDIGAKVIVYEPNINKSELTVIDSLDSFKENSDLIITNRYNRDLKDAVEKIYTRDIFSRD